ncbi:Rrf2 family transcriptional regulator [Cohnella endophytica]|uniref:Rrf2 family transcriptional regulator n=1 Tax=Cohnella endophytica TaxID=2419778 RepID=A0A494XPM3_9BACL|nr:Rrf2 family transcriptional regulator [Cohnella endophytica]RKP51661.1 Rrf2 family transcriptional regulator [Cohnella endophytica]
MKYSNATNYALHTIVYLAVAPTGKSLGVKPIADFQNLSPTYLSKIMAKLVKAGFVESTVGVNGGYRLTKKPEDVSFLDVIEAVEGQESLFECDTHHDSRHSSRCLIQSVMNEAENRMEQLLRERTIADIADQAGEAMRAFVNREAQ